MLGGGAAIIKYPGLSACGVIPFWILDFGFWWYLANRYIVNSKLCTGGFARHTCFHTENSQKPAPTIQNYLKEWLQKFLLQ